MAESDSDGMELVSRRKLPIKKVWHTQQEEILKRWSEIGSSYRFMHDRSYSKFEKQNLRFALPVIVISTITGTANFAQGTFPPSWQPYVPLGIGFLNLTAGLLTTVAQFLRVSELLEGHRAAAIAYSKFSRNISVELSLPRQERTCGGTEFVNNCRAELDRLIEQTPNIPLAIIRKFGKKFGDNPFHKPDILTISAVNIFKDTKREAERAALAAIKQEELRKREIIKTQMLENEKNMVELAKKKALDRKYSEEEKKKRKMAKKEAVDFKNVKASMSKLLAKLAEADKAGAPVTPDSTDDDDTDDDTKDKNPSVVLTVKDKKPENEVISTELEDTSKKEL